MASTLTFCAFACGASLTGMMVMPTVATAESRKAAALFPAYVAIEPPELIGSGVSVGDVARSFAAALERGVTVAELTPRHETLEDLFGRDVHARGLARRARSLHATIGRGTGDVTLECHRTFRR